MAGDAAVPMSLQQLEAFLERAQGDPGLRAPLASAPDAEAIAAIATAAGFVVTVDDLITAMGEPPAVLEVIELLATASDPPQGELEAFLQQVELDPDLQTALASAADAEAVAAIARIAGFGLSAEDLWEASNECTAALEPGPFDNLADLLEVGVDGQSAARTEAVEALGAFLRQVEVDPDLQSAVASAEDAAAVVALARGAGFAVTEEALWGASDETPEALRESQGTDRADDAVDPVAQTALPN
jgi:predicted ribosomally synthesized peptide with nif11-like leader